MATDKTDRASTDPIEYEQPRVVSRIVVQAILGKDPGGPSGN